MSALPPKADMCGAKGHVRFTLKSGLKSELAREVETTREKILDELEEARQIAKPQRFYAAVGHEQVDEQDIARPHLAAAEGRLVQARNDFARQEFLLKRDVVSRATFDAQEAPDMALLALDDQDMLLVGFAYLNRD